MRRQFDISEGQVFLRSEVWEWIAALRVVARNISSLEKRTGFLDFLEALKEVYSDKGERSKSYPVTRSDYVNVATGLKAAFGRANPGRLHYLRGARDAADDILDLIDRRDKSNDDL